MQGQQVHRDNELDPVCVYLSHRRLQNKQMGHSRRKSCEFPPHSGPGSGRVRRSCCSSQDNQPEPRGWSLLWPPGPGWHHLAAESECSHGSLSAWTLSHLSSQTADMQYINESRRMPTSVGFSLVCFGRTNQDPIYITSKNYINRHAK